MKQNIDLPMSNLTTQKKPILIILPGWGGSRETWADFVVIAKECFDVHVIDLPCFGSEPCPPDVWGLEEYAQFVKDTIAKTTNRPIVLLGHSFGGQVAASVVAANPAIVDMLILTGAAIYRKKRPIKNFFFGAAAKMGKSVFSLPILSSFRDAATKLLYRVAHSDYAETSGMAREIYKKITRQDVSHLLPKIAVSTLVVWGENDAQTPIRFGKKIARGIPNATFIMVKNGTHGLHHETKKELLETIVNFVSNRT